MCMTEGLRVCREYLGGVCSYEHLLITSFGSGGSIVQKILFVEICRHEKSRSLERTAVRLAAGAFSRDDA